MPSTYIKSGSTVRVYDSSVEAYDGLPVGTYVVEFHPMMGFSLRLVEDMAVGEARVYGSRRSKVDKIMRAWEAGSRSLGVMLSGDKGQGKSLFLRMLASAAVESGLPVVKVAEAFDGLASFIDTLGPCLVVFDEFEKIFPSARRGEGSDEQVQFLGLFDGTSATRRMYCVTVNDLFEVSSYLVNRPGRFHYHLRFDYPSADEVALYLREQVSRDDPRIPDAVRFSAQVPLNYDHLRAIAFEMRSDPGASFQELVEDLNIKAVEKRRYVATARYEDAPDLVGEISLNPFAEGRAQETIYLRAGSRCLYGSFSPADLRSTDRGFVLDGPRISLSEDEKEDRPVEVLLDLAGQSSYAYTAF